LFYYTFVHGRGKKNLLQPPLKGKGLGTSFRGAGPKGTKRGEKRSSPSHLPKNDKETKKHRRPQGVKSGLNGNESQTCIDPKERTAAQKKVKMSLRSKESGNGTRSSCLPEETTSWAWSQIGVCQLILCLGFQRRINSNGILG